LDTSSFLSGLEETETAADVPGMSTEGAEQCQPLNLTRGSSVPCLAYSGDILDTDIEEDVPLWSEAQWSEQRMEEAQQRVEKQGAAVSDYWREK
jgi:hypothetical protein